MIIVTFISLTEEMLSGYERGELVPWYELSKYLNTGKVLEALTPVARIFNVSFAGLYTGGFPVGMICPLYRVVLERKYRTFSIAVSLFTLLKKVMELVAAENMA